MHCTGWLRLTYLVPVGCQDTGTVLGQESNCFLSCLDPPGGGGGVEKKREIPVLFCPNRVDRTREERRKESIISFSIISIVPLAA